MATQLLKKRTIDATNPEPGKRVYLWDTEVKGFGIRCIGGGSKIFLLKRQKAGRQSWIRIGEFGSEFTLDQAREIARAKSGDLAKGIDLAKIRDDRKKAPKVEDLVERFFEEEGHKLKPRTLQEYTRQFKRHLSPGLNGTRVEDVTFSDIEKIHLSLQDTPILSNRVHAALSRLFNMAERWGIRPQGTNPCARHEKYREESRERYLSDDELTKLGETLDSGTEDLVITNAVRFLLFSGWRLNEALQLKWSTVDDKAKIIRLGDTKGGAATIDINPAMATILEVMKAHKQEMKKKAEEERARKLREGEKADEVEENPFVFPGREKGSYLVNLRKPWLRICEQAGIEGVRLHDLRRTFGTIGASDAGLTHETIGKVLRHKQTSTTAIYARLAGSVRKEASEKIGEAIKRKLAPSQEMKSEKKAGA